MSISATCPGCNRSYRLADAMRGKRVRCQSCAQVFIIRAEDDERIQTSPRPAKQIVRYEEDEITERPRPRRRPRKKHSNAAILPLIIAGCVTVGALILLLGGFAIWTWGRSRQLHPVPAAFNANLPALPAQNPAPPQRPADIPLPPMVPPVNLPAQGLLAAELTNGKVSGFGAQMEVTVDYRFTSGNPAGRRLFLVIKATKFGGLGQNYYLAELRSIGNQTRGTVQASGMSFGIEHGPFEMWIGEGPPGPPGPVLLLAEGDIKKISNIVTVAVKQNTLPGIRLPIGPRRVLP